MRLGRAGVVGIAAVAALAACGGDAEGKHGQPGTQPADTSLESKTIQDLDDLWQHGIYNRDTAVVTSVYAQDALLVPPTGPAAQGRDAIKTTYAELYRLPGLAFTFETGELHLSSDAQMGYEVGSYTSRVRASNASADDQGKYVTVWEKREGRWRVVAQMFNSERR